MLFAEQQVCASYCPFTPKYRSSYSVHAYAVYHAQTYNNAAWVCTLTKFGHESHYMVIYQEQMQ